MVTKKRWNSFVCPGCRFVFRVPRDRDGGGTICPSCQTTLRLPKEGEEPRPLTRAAPGPAFSAPAAAEPSHAPADETAGSERSSVGLLAGLVVLGLAGLAGFAMWLKPRPHAEHAAEVAETLPAPQPAVVHQPVVKDKSLEAFDSTHLLKMAEPVVKGFLNAKGLEQILPFVHEPEKVRQRWAQWQGSEHYEVPGLNNLDEKSVSVSGNLISVNVTVGDFSKRAIALRVDGDQAKVDWESWAGWCEMTWKEFRRQKPTEPKLFRVSLSKRDYFNFEFSDDKKWSAYSLESADGSEAIYGYALSGSPLDTEIRPVGADAKKAKDHLILRLHFPANATHDNQVIIESTEGQGWIEP